MLRTTVLVFAIFFGSVLHASERFALVIGNDNYNEVASLELARADAKSYAELLSERGFQVTQLEDVDARTMRRSLALFYDKISPGDTVAFVFAGHGWSDGRENYLIPTDAQLSSSPTVIAAESFSLGNGANGIVDEIKRRRPRFLFAVIDACRNNPFRSGNRTRSIGMERGLSVISAPTGTFIAFSAGAGQTALDRLSDNDQAQNSVFTRYFIRELRQQQDIQSAFKATQIAVVNSATKIGHPQRPAYYDEVVGRACLEGACISRPQQTVDTNFDATKRADILFWDSINESKDPADFNEYLQRFPDGTFSGVARRRIASLNFSSDKPEVTTDFLQELVEPADIEEALGLNKADYKRVQVALNALGFSVGAEDGAFGQKSRAGLRKFQTRKRAEATGYLTEQSLASLEQAFEKIPKTYEGDWEISIYRDSYSPTDPHDWNWRLASARLRLVNDELTIVSSHFNPKASKRDLFSTFRGRLTEDGEILISMVIDYDGGKRKERRVTFNEKLPRYMNFGSYVEFRGPLLTGSTRGPRGPYDRAWAKLTVLRTR